MNSGQYSSLPLRDESTVLRSILDSIDPAFLERLPYRVLLALVYDSMTMDGKMSFLIQVMIYDADPAIREKALRNYLTNGESVLLFAWTDLLKRGVVEDQIPPELLKMRS